MLLSLQLVGDILQVAILLREDEEELPQSQSRWYTVLTAKHFLEHISSNWDSVRPYLEFVQEQLSGESSGPALDASGLHSVRLSHSQHQSLMKELNTARGEEFTLRGLRAVWAVSDTGLSSRQSAVSARQPVSVRRWLTFLDLVPV